MAGQRAEVRVLTGEEEARMELRAARFLARRSDCGLLSGGGASCQLALGGDGGVISILAGTVEAKQAIERDGFEAGWAWWLARLTELPKEVPDLPLGGFCGEFIGIEMQCTCAHNHAGLPRDTVVTRDIVLEALVALVDAWIDPNGKVKV